VSQSLYKTPNYKILKSYQLRIRQTLYYISKNSNQDIETHQIQLSHLTKEVTPSNKDMHPTTKQGLCHRVEGPYPTNSTTNTKHTIQQLNHNFVTD